MHDFETCPAGAHSYVGEIGEEELVMKNVVDDEADDASRVLWELRVGQGKEGWGGAGWGRIFMVL